MSQPLGQRVHMEKDFRILQKLLGKGLFLPGPKPEAVMWGREEACHLGRVYKVNMEENRRDEAVTWRPVSGSYA
jgi:hypothetical protein